MIFFNTDFYSLFLAIFLNIYFYFYYRYVFSVDIDLSFFYQHLLMSKLIFF